MNGDPKGIGAGRDTTGSSGPKLGGVGGAQRGLRHRKGRGGAKQKSFIPEQKWGRPLPPPQSPGAELGGRADAHPGGVGGGGEEEGTQNPTRSATEPRIDGVGTLRPPGWGWGWGGIGGWGGGGARVYPTRPRGAFTALQGRGLPNARGGGAGCGSGSGLPRGARRAERWKSLFGAVSEAGGAAGPPLCRPAELRAQRWR